MKALEMTGENTSSRWLSVVLSLSLLVLAECSKRGSNDANVERQSPLRVAVAANFTAPIAHIVASFEAETGYDVEVSTGSTGKLCAQIENGAPFHVFLSADEGRPARLERAKLAKPGSRFTYAVGRLALYGKALKYPADGPRNLEGSELDHLAIANPRTAPYGAAAKQALEKLGLWPKLEARIVQGENIAQTYQFVDTGSAELGFVALSAVVERPRYRYWVVPQSLHEPIRQDAVLLARGVAHPAAAEFIDFLKSPEARRIIEKAGYVVP